MKNDSSYAERIFESSLEGFPHALQGIGTIAREVKIYGSGVAVNGAVGIKQIADEVGRYWQIYRNPGPESEKPNLYKVGSGIINTTGAVLYGSSSAGALGSTLGGVGAITQGLSYYSAKFAPGVAGEFNDSSFSRRIADASREGFPLILQGVGTIAGNAKIYGAGIAVNGLVGLQQVVDEAERCLKIYWHPEDAHPNPNYYKIGAGIVNMAGAAVYGAYSAGVLGPVAGGAAAITQGLTYYASNLLPQDAGNYCPPLPTHSQRTAGSEVPSFQMFSHPVPEPGPSQAELRTAAVVGQFAHPDSPQPSSAPGRPSMAWAAALRVAGSEDRGSGGGAVEVQKASSVHHQDARTAVHGNPTRHARRATM
ncbi:hypothetical protein [Streptomyces sp. NPDC058394]|uniref:hypothetical protein n=1 Tax=Streptomyces sp. NPDC058394 TaxID=3346477 RepID=UPI00364F7085